MLVLIEGLSYNQRERDLRFAVKRNVDFEGLVSSSFSGFLANGPYSAPVYYGVAGSFYMVSPYIADLYNSPMHREVTFCFDSAFKYGGVALVNQYKGVTAFHKRFSLKLRDNFAVMLKFRKTYYYLTPQGNIFGTFQSPYILGDNSLRYSDFGFSNSNWLLKQRWVALARVSLVNSTPLFSFVSNFNIHINGSGQRAYEILNLNLLTLLNNSVSIYDFSNLSLSNSFIYNINALSTKFYMNLLVKFYLFQVNAVQVRPHLLLHCFEFKRSQISLYTCMANIVLSIKFFIYFVLNGLGVKVNFILNVYILNFLFENIFYLLQFFVGKLTGNFVFVWELFNTLLLFLKKLLILFLEKLFKLGFTSAVKFFFYFMFLKKMIELNLLASLMFKKLNLNFAGGAKSKNMLYANLLFLNNVNFNHTLKAKTQVMSDFGLGKYFQYIDTRALFTLSNISVNWANFIAARPRIRRVKVERLFMARPIAWTRKVFLEGFLKKSKLKSKFYVWTKFFNILFPIIKRVYLSILKLRLTAMVGRKRAEPSVAKLTSFSKKILFHMLSKHFKKKLALGSFVNRPQIFTRQGRYKQSSARTLTVVSTRSNRQVAFFLRFLIKLAKAIRTKQAQVYIARAHALHKRTSTLAKWLVFLKKRILIKKLLKVHRGFQWQYSRFFVNNYFHKFFYQNSTDALAVEHVEMLQGMFVLLKKNVQDLCAFFQVVRDVFYNLFFFRFLAKFKLGKFASLTQCFRNKLFFKYVISSLHRRAKFTNYLKYYFVLFKRLQGLLKLLLDLIKEFLTYIRKKITFHCGNSFKWRLGGVQQLKSVLRFLRKKRYGRIYKNQRALLNFKDFFRSSKLRLFFKYKQVAFKRRTNTSILKVVNKFKQVNFLSSYKGFLQVFVKKYGLFFNIIGDPKQRAALDLFQRYFFKEFYFYLNMRVVTKISLTTVIGSISMVAQSSRLLKDAFRYYYYCKAVGLSEVYLLYLQNIFYLVYKRFFCFNYKISYGVVTFIKTLMQIFYVYLKFFSKYLQLFSYMRTKQGFGRDSISFKAVMLQKIVKSFYGFFVIFLNYIFNCVINLESNREKILLKLFGVFGLFSVNSYKNIFYNNLFKVLNVNFQSTNVKQVTSKILWSGFFLKIRKRPEVRKNLEYWVNSYRLNFLDTFSGQFLRKLHLYYRPGFLRRGFRLEFVYPQTVKFVDRIARLTDSVDLFLVNYTRLLSQYKQNMFFYQNFMRLLKGKIMKFFDLNFHRPRFFDHRPIRRYRLLARDRLYTAPFFIKTVFQVNFFYFSVFNLFDSFFFNQIILYKFFYFKYKIFLRSAYFLTGRFWNLKQVTYMYMFLFEQVKNADIKQDFRKFIGKPKMHFAHFTAQITTEKLRRLVLTNMFLLFKFFLNFKNFINFYFSLTFLKFFFQNCRAILVNLCLNKLFVAYNDSIKTAKLRFFFAFFQTRQTPLWINPKVEWSANFYTYFFKFRAQIQDRFYLVVRERLVVLIAFFKTIFRKFFLAFLVKTKLKFLFKFFYLFFSFTLKIIFINFLSLSGCNYKLFFVFNILNKYLSFSLIEKNGVLLGDSFYQKFGGLFVKKLSFVSKRKAIYRARYNAFHLNWNLTLLKAFNLNGARITLPFLVSKNPEVAVNINLALRNKFADFFKSSDMLGLVHGVSKQRIFFYVFSYKQLYVSSVRQAVLLKVSTKMFLAWFQRTCCADFVNGNYFLGSNQNISKFCQFCYVVSLLRNLH